MLLNIANAAYKKAADLLGIDVSVVKGLATVEAIIAPFAISDKINIVYHPEVFNVEYFNYHLKIATQRIKDENVGVASGIISAKIGEAARAIRNKTFRMSQNYPEIINVIPAPYHGNSLEWIRLEKAKEFNEDAALCSTEWGSFKMFGNQHEFFGYETVQEFVDVLSTSAESQFDLFIQFILKNPMLHACVKHENWGEFVKLYQKQDFNGHEARLISAVKSYKNI